MMNEKVGLPWRRSARIAANWLPVLLCGQLLTGTAAIAQPAQRSEASPPNPFRLGEEELRAGNPLAGYVRLLELEEAYRAAGQERLFYDSKATRQAYLGDTQGALESWAKLNQKRPARDVPKSSPLDDYKPADAIAVIVEKARNHSVVMIGEEHVQPQTRSILKPLLEQLRQQGFRYFAAETFSEDLEATVKLGYATYDTGFYTCDPVFAEAVTEALRLGYQLVPYEQREPPEEDKPDDPLFGQNWRELVQARNLKTRIFDKDPKAKVLVWAGRAHIAEETGEVPGVGTLKPMGFQFRELTGIDPFTVYLPAGTEQAGPECETDFYRYATSRGWVKRPTIFIKPDGTTFGYGGDAVVFFPRVTVRSGRPDWLARELDRVAVDIPKELLAGKGLRLVQAFHVEDFDKAVPADQILVGPDDASPVLMLPKGRDYWIRCIDASGDVRGPVKTAISED